MDLAFIGDSHVQYFGFGVKNGLFKPYKAKVKMVSAATCYGLMKDSSTTGARKQIDNFLKTLPPETQLFFQFGEVDCGILIWLLAEANQTSPADQAKIHVDRYISYLKQIRNRGFKNIAITSPTLPTISDIDHIGEVVTIRRSKIKASFRERTDLTLAFNRTLRERAEDEGFTYIHGDASFLDHHSQLSSTTFRNKKRGDHHMDNPRAGVVWAGLVNKELPNRSDRKVALLATQDSYLKKLTDPSTELPSEFLWRVKPGEIIETSIAGTHNGHYILCNAHIQQRNISNQYRFAWPGHFDLTNTKSWDTFQTEEPPARNHVSPTG